MTKILLVEDEESFREGLSFMLSKEGYEVITADKEMMQFHNLNNMERI
jgi:DNA-binding response OmpR family regulator